MQRADGVGAGGAVQLEADLGHAEPRLAGRGPGAAAATRSSTSRASARRLAERRLVPSVVRQSCSRSDQLAQRRARRGAGTIVPARAAPGRGAAGSAKVAVPTWTARAPASSSSTASSPRRDAATPTIGSVRDARRGTSCTARTATGWIAGPDSPPPPVAEPVAGGSRGRWPCPCTVLTRVTASAPPRRARAGDRRRGR